MKKNRRLHGILVPIPDPDAQMSNPESDPQENKKKTDPEPTELTGSGC